MVPTVTAIGYRPAIKAQLVELLETESTSDEVREGALALAGFVGSPDLAESISTAWRLARDKDRLIPEAFWAACHCYGPDPDELFRPILVRWSQLPDDEGDKFGTTRKLNIAEELSWALSRGIDGNIIDYLVDQSAAIPSLSWPMTIMLEHINAPEAVEFIARRAAEVQERVRATNGFSPWVMCLRNTWDVSRGASRRLSSESLERLKALWQDSQSSELLARESFHLWSTGASNEDLDDLKAVRSDGPIYEQALWTRTTLGDHRGRDATVLLIPVGESVDRRYRDTGCSPVRSVRRVKATQETCADALLAKCADPDELARSLIDSDPEIDVEIAGRATGPCDRVHIDGDGQILYAPSVVEVRYGPDGIEQERRPLSVRPSNLVTSAPPVWSGALLPRGEAIRRYAFTRAYQVMHSNALEFDFLYGIAAYLNERQVMAQVGSGRLGKGPLICERNGPKYRGFLDGRIQGDAMRMVLYLAAFELAPPEERP